ncbi:MAG TPA: hypothetical protein VLA04_01020 [Verrucomicrobiae bacterium]|nr:hypothetical protein [Verrucomicrobiae bacterium]
MLLVLGIAIFVVFFAGTCVTLRSQLSKETALRTEAERQLHLLLPSLGHRVHSYAILQGYGVTARCKDMDNWQIDNRCSATFLRLCKDHYRQMGINGDALLPLGGETGDINICIHRGAWNNRESAFGWEYIITDSAGKTLLTNAIPNTFIGELKRDSKDLELPQHLIDDLLKSAQILRCNAEQVKANRSEIELVIASDEELRLDIRG